jgi:hypothetical protein
LNSDSHRTIVASDSGIRKRRKTATTAIGSVALRMAPQSSAGPSGTRTSTSAAATIAAVSTTPGPTSVAMARHWRRTARRFRFHAASKSSAGRKT